MEQFLSSFFSEMFLIYFYRWSIHSFYPLMIIQCFPSDWRHLYWEFLLIDYEYCSLNVDFLLQCIQPTKLQQNLALLRKWDNTSSNVIINFHCKLISLMRQSQNLYCKKWSIVDIVKIPFWFYQDEVIQNRFKVLLLFSNFPTSIYLM